MKRFCAVTRKHCRSKKLTMSVRLNRRFAIFTANMAGLTTSVARIVETRLWSGSRGSNSAITSAFEETRRLKGVLIHILLRTSSPARSPTYTIVLLGPKLIPQFSPLAPSTGFHAYSCAVVILFADANALHVCPESPQHTHHK